MTVLRKAAALKAAPIPKTHVCTNCGMDAFVGYGEGWEGKVKKGERLCTRCFKNRGGINMFERKRAPTV